MYFSEYMKNWLYQENFGYYSTFKNIGKKGDFYTAVSSSSLFGASIANFFYNKIKENSYKSDGWLIEIGAHQGYLICDMIHWLYSCDSNLVKSLKFGIIESSLEVQKEQKKYIYSRFGNDVKINFFQSISELNETYAFIVSNEIFDSFPADIFYKDKILKVENNKIEWVEANSKIIEFSKKYNLIKGEIALGYEEFARDIANSFKECDFVSFDYGEKYVRNDFSMRIYQEHKVFQLFEEGVKLEELYQKSDITYDVNFQHIIDSFQKNNFTLIDYKTQAKALIDFGIIDILEQLKQKVKNNIYLSEANKVKTLISPTIMGERFKMILFHL